MRVKLKELGRISTGNTPSKNVPEFYSSEDIGFVKPDIISELQIDYIENTTEYLSEKARNKARIVKKDAIFVTCIGNIGKIGIAKNKEFAFNQQINAIEPNEKILPEYLAYGIFANKRRLQAIANAPVVPIINKTQFSEFEIEIISDKKEQLKIVELLDKVRKIITKQKEELEKLDTLVKSRFIEMFGDPILNEKNWNTEIWENVLIIVNGRNQKGVEDDDGHYLICGSGGVIGKASQYLVNANSVIVGRKGNINKPILMREKYWNVDTAFGLEPNIEKINADYLYMFCKFFDFETLNKAVTIPSLTKSDLLKIEMPIPPIELQNQFADFVKQVDKSKFSCYTSDSYN